MANPLLRFFVKTKNAVYTERLRRKYRNKIEGVTIFSQNCLAGIIYHRLGLPFLSPTIDMYIEGRDFYRFLKDPERYMNIAPVEIKDYPPRFPHLKIDDVALHCMHYESSQVAKAAWERRKKRVNYERIIVIVDSWNCGQDRDLIHKILSLSYPTILISDQIEHASYPNCLYLDPRNYLTGPGRFPSPNPLGISADRYRRNVEKDFDFYGQLARVISDAEKTIV